MKRLRCLMAMSLAFATYPGLAQAQAPPLSDRAAARILEQSTWGPTPASIVDLQQKRLPKWLDSQFSINTSDLPDQPILTSDGKNNNDLRPVQRAFYQNAVTGEDQLRQRVAFALSEIWVVSDESGVHYAYAFPPYWRILRDNAFTSYRDIIKAVTLSPAMGRYLNMANNNKGNPAKGTAANENYARELMQLFTLGLSQLNPDGSLALDSTKRAIPTYDQAVVTNMAKALTGWTYPTAPGKTPKGNNPEYYLGSMFAVEANHDATAKTIFGNVTIPAGQTAEQDLASVLDALMKQPTLAPFVSKQLIQHLVTSNPSPNYIRNVSSVFTQTNGDMKAVITAILTDPEARGADQPSITVDATFGHLREPVLFMANILRGLNATLSDTSAINNDSTAMGQNLFYAPSVFSYFSPQSRTEKGLFSPEFQIYSTQTVATRADIVNSALYGAIDSGTKVNLAPFVSWASDVNELLTYINYVFMHDAMSNDLQRAAYDAATAATTPQSRAQAALYIVLTSGEYQIIH